MTTYHKLVVGVVLLTLVLVVGGAWLSDNNSVANRERLNKPLMGEKIADQVATHVARNATHEAYNSNPPTSGPHFGDGVAGPGIKTEPVPDELVLHSMEHGAVVLWYKDDLSESDVDKLRNVFQSASGKKIMLPRQDLDVPIALTSWGYLLKLETIDEARIKEFIETNTDRAPEKAPI